MGSLQNIESAEAAGDRTRRGVSLAVNGLGTLAAALFGTCFPTTIYIGHPGWKALGARAGYSVLNGVFITLLCLTGTLAVDRLGRADGGGHGHRAVDRPRDHGAGVPGDAARHAPAVVVGLLPGVAAWGALLKAGLRAAGLGVPGARRSAGRCSAASSLGPVVDGVSRSSRASSYQLDVAAAAVCVIERRFRRAAAGALPARCSRRWADPLLPLDAATRCSRSRRPGHGARLPRWRPASRGAWVTFPVDDASGGH